MSAQPVRPERSRGTRKTQSAPSTALGVNGGAATSPTVNG